MRGEDRNPPHPTGFYEVCGLHTGKDQPMMDGLVPLLVLIAAGIFSVALLLHPLYVVVMQAVQ